MSRSSIAAGDVVLCNLPPYSTQPWLGMGVVLHYALLTEAGIAARVVRPIDPPYAVPDEVLHASMVTFTFDPPLDQRLIAMDRAYLARLAFFDDMLDALCSGPERVFGLSLFRNNLDVSLWMARRLKERRPDAYVVLGGPEAIEEPAALLLPWIDAVVGADAEAILVPLFRALLDRAPARLTALRNVWVNPALAPSEGDPAGRPASPTPSIPTIDYAPILGLYEGDQEATVPLLFNWGCPYSCAFCSNRVVYSRFTPGTVDRVLDEIDAIVSGWRSLHAGDPPGLTLQFSDATTNALPALFDDLLRGVVARGRGWSMRPYFRGQTLFDTRITEARVALWSEANFGGTFFGLDGANDGLRRSLSKPGGLVHVADAMRVYHRGGRGGLTFGVPVGLPGETDEHYEASVRFVEWAANELASSLESITVLPYMFFLSAQDPALSRDNRGERRGVLWRADGPGGDPAVRARRFMQMFDRLDGRVPANSPVPPYLALPAMLPEADPASLEAWMSRHGRAFDQLAPHASQILARKKVGEAQPPSAEWERAEQAFDSARPPGGWTLEGKEWRGEGARKGLVAVFRRADPDSRAAILLERRDPERRAFTRTRDFDVSYLNRWQGLPCVFDAELTGYCARKVGRAETTE